MDKEKLLKYSAELSLLAQLLQNRLISETEFKEIKQKLMDEYKIVSDFTTAMTA